MQKSKWFCERNTVNVHLNKILYIVKLSFEKISLRGFKGEMKWFKCFKEAKNYSSWFEISGHKEYQIIVK